MLKTIAVAAKDRQRLAEIIAIITRSGAGALLGRIGLGQDASQASEGVSETLPARTRKAMEALGPTFVKLGQILATRPDLLPPEWIVELEGLHSGVAALPFEALRPDVEAALGEAPETAFAEFDPFPLAAASIAQVHRATTHDGRLVVLKIRRPGIRERMEADLRLIAQLAVLAEKANAEVRRFQPRALLRQLGEAVLDELDFTIEARNAERFTSDFAANPHIVVPTVHWEWTSEALLVMEYVEGIPPLDPARLIAAGIDPRRIAATGAEAILDMVLVNGVFHGDPHPGNLLCLPGDRIALLDLGMVGHVSPRRREELLMFVQSLASGDPAALADTLLCWSEGAEVSRPRLLAAADRLIARHSGGPLLIGAIVADFMGMMREERLALPPDLALIFKALVTIDGVLTRIDPGFDLSATMQRAGLRVVRAKFSPETIAASLQSLAWEISRRADDAPHLIRAAIRRLEHEPPLPLDITPLAGAIRAASHRLVITLALGFALIAITLFLRN